MPDMPETNENGVITETEALELLALLTTSARIQLEEPAHYGPLRLLTATERLCAMMLERSSDDSRAFLEDAIERIPALHMQMSDVERYTEGLDELCRLVAQCLVRDSGAKADQS